ncbi:hypothetical protein B0H15DRAFT_816699 [Mycena belliarum]|uniref:Uncharacterized protein n=1 Tax=Mycena belliarum TaxID=1033014 RepID=A0AAD6UEH2_9AGAR|nr:hypothetical protein B0H15DRAFT_816699 [Mycena belliae]
MPNSYLEQLWSRYHASPEPGMASLYRTCSAITKHVLQPSHIILSGGGFTLLPDLTDPLPYVISGMNSVLRLAAQEHGLRGIPSIGTLELDVLTNTGLHLCSTQNQVVRSWVILIDRLAAAMRDINYLCVGDPLHLSRHPWTSRIPSVLASLPPSLRVKLPAEFLCTHGIMVLPRTANVSPASVQTGTVMPRVASPPLRASAAPPSSAVSLETLADRVKSIAGTALLHSSHIVDDDAQRLIGRFALGSRVFNSLETMVRDLQSELNGPLSSSPDRTSGFVVDPHGVLLQILRGSSSIDELSVAWTAIGQRMTRALNRLGDYQSKHTQQQKSGVHIPAPEALPQPPFNSRYTTPAPAPHRPPGLCFTNEPKPVNALEDGVEARTVKDTPQTSRLGAAAHRPAVEAALEGRERVGVINKKLASVSISRPTLLSQSSVPAERAAFTKAVELKRRDKIHRHTLIPALGKVRTSDRASGRHCLLLQVACSSRHSPALVSKEGPVQIGGPRRGP